MTITAGTARTAAKLLSGHDPALRPVIDLIGPCTVRPHGDYYGALVDSIISQQLSVKAARSIEARFCALFGRTSFPSAEEFLQKSPEELKAAGLSRPKVMYIQDLARHVVNGDVHFDHLASMTNQEIIDELIQVRGIGEWTVHMFLIFCMARSDVLPHGDLGIKNGIQKLYGLDHPPSPLDITSLAKDHNWHPYESVASWYIWRSLELQQAQ